ncbi:MAG TPA: RibD family protein [Quisquiliibacterium sp.]|nr:RibD family protein [Quisquiliibacterium sp.]
MMAPREPHDVPPPPAADEPAWQAVLQARRALTRPPGPSALADLYGPLCDADAAHPFAVAHLAQSLDGRIATTGGLSKWLSGDADLLHTHRMRALSDAVVVGVNTVLHDDPQLTVRRCTGRNPVRVVIDPDGRLDGSQRVFRDGAAPTLLLVAAGRAHDGGARHGHADVVPIPRTGDTLDPIAIRAALAQRGLTWLFIEGGGTTVSRFLAAGALDRLQVTVAPVIIGSGRPGLVLPEISDLRHCLRPRTRRVTLGDDTMFECIFHD